MKFYFDMDGTVADLYAVDSWLPKLRAFDVTPYIEAKPMVDMGELSKICLTLISKGHDIGVITWGSLETTPEYDKQVAAAKLAWVKEHMPYIKEKDFHFLRYGIKKQTVVPRSAKSCLIDDNEKVRQTWDTKIRRVSIDAKSKDILQELRSFT